MLRVQAIVRMLATDEGGRRTSCSTGYRPTIRFGAVYTESSFTVAGDRLVMPGDECHVEISFVNPSYVRRWLVAGQEFDVTEASRKVGHGRILSVDQKEE